MNARNYQREMEAIIEKCIERGERPALLLHACCAPCSSYCLISLYRYFRICVFYYNPNITVKEEYEKRVLEVKRLIREVNEEYGTDITFTEGGYDPDRFYKMAEGLEHVPEGGARCFGCYRLRLEEAAKEAVAGGYDYFTTTLSISPLKNAAKLNEIGEELASACGVAYLPSDFKKKDGYKQSIELSRKYNLYRQNYCGCEFSRRSLDS